MREDKFILLVEAQILPEHNAAITAFAAATLEKTRQEPGFEMLYQTMVMNAPDKLVFFEVFDSEEAHRTHLEQPYTKDFFSFLEGKLAGPPVITRLKKLAS